MYKQKQHEFNKKIGILKILRFECLIDHFCVFNSIIQICNNVCFKINIQKNVN